MGACGYLQAQRLPIPDALTIQDGLGFRDVTAIAQDGRGLIWFGTAQGIERFDGLNFIKFGTNQQADIPFPSDDVLYKGILLINDSSLWVIANGILYALNLRTHRASNISGAAGLQGKVFTLVKARDNTVWVVTDDEKDQRLLKYLGNAQFQQIATAKHLSIPFNTVACDTAGNVWWSTNAQGLRLFNPEGKRLHAAKPDSFIWYGTKLYHTPVYCDSRNRVFILPKSVYQIWQYFPETGQHTVIANGLPSPAYNNLEDSRGNLWFATRSGLLRWSPAGEWTDFSASLHSSLQFSNIRQLYEDHTHLLWIATDNGLLRFPIGREMFQNYLTVPGAAWGNAMRGIFADKQGEVYAFCENGQRGLHQLENAQHKDRLIFPFNDSLSLAPVMEHVDYFIFDKKRNATWTLNNNLMQFNTELIRGSLVGNFEQESNKLSHNPFHLLQDGSLILGSSLENLVLYDPEKKQRDHFLSPSSSAGLTGDTEVFWESPSGEIWVGTASHGLFCFNRKGETLAHFSTKTQPALSNDHVLSLLFDKKGNLWAGTFGGGLCCLGLSGIRSPEQLKKLQIRIFTQKEGLCNNNVVSVLEDDYGNIWAATYNGLSCYRVAEDEFRNFYEEDGLSNNEFNYASFLKDEQGGLWFGGMNGINYFNPKDILQMEKNPALCFTGFTKYNSLKDSTLVQVIGSQNLERFDISPYDNWFQFSWALPNFFKPDKNHYYVRMEGLESDWSYLGSTPFVRYNKLPAGDYTLRVKASDSKGNWSIRELAVPITVHPFYYQTSWFYLLILLLVGVVGYGIARYRHYRLLEIERMRTRIASDLHDEVGSMLSGLSMQAELLGMTASEKDRSRAEHIGDISRMAVSKMRDLVWSIDSRRDKVKNLLDRMQEQAMELLQPQDITCHFELGELPLEKKLSVNLRQHLFLIFKESLNNIIRHSNASEVWVRFGNFKGQFEMSIHDNGNQPKKSNVSTGMGLSNMVLRSEKIGAKLTLQQEDGFSVKLHMKAL